jgi:hypothetical protein
MNTTFDRQAGKDEWLTPKYITDALAPFDLDPSASIVRPWEIAAKCYTIEDNGLFKPWDGFVWNNPPYGNETQKWFRRMAEHNNGISLTFARTETRMFFDSVWGKASAMLFLKRRIAFCDTTGKPASGAGAPSVLIAYGAVAAERLRQSKLEGALVESTKIQ